MAYIMTSSAISKRYAKALLSAAVDQNIVSEVKGDAKSLIELIKSSAELKAFVRDPLIQPRLKAQIFERLFAGRLQAITLNFLGVLALKQRERDLYEILTELVRQVDERDGIVAVQVKSAIELSEDQKKEIAQKISNYIKSRVRLEITVDPKLKGGFTAKVGDTTFDGSLSSQLNRLKDQLKRG